MRLGPPLSTIARRTSSGAIPFSLASSGSARSNAAKSILRAPCSTCQQALVLNFWALGFVFRVRIVKLPWRELVWYAQGGLGGQWQFRVSVYVHKFGILAGHNNSATPSVCTPSGLGVPTREAVHCTRHMFRNLSGLRSSEKHCPDLCSQQSLETDSELRCRSAGCRHGIQACKRAVHHVLRYHTSTALQGGH